MGWRQTENYEDCDAVGEREVFAEQFFSWGSGFLHVGFHFVGDEVVVGGVGS
jgi:hypothetical protein